MRQSELNNLKSRTVEIQKLQHQELVEWLKW
jgi:hypothetical protein